MAVVKFLYAFFDVYLIGQVAYSIWILFMQNIDAVEKAALCISSLIFLGFRIRSLHLDNQKKELDNQERRNEIMEKKLELQERENKLKRG